MLTHELRCVDAKHRGCIYKEVLCTTLPCPIHHCRNWDFGLGSELCCEFKDVISYKNKRKPWCSQILLCSCINNAKILPNIFPGKISRGNTTGHIRSNYGPRCFLMNFIKKFAHELLVKFNSIDWFILAKVEVFCIFVEVVWVQLKSSGFTRFTLWNFSASFAAAWLHFLSNFILNFMLCLPWNKEIRGCGFFSINMSSEVHGDRCKLLGGSSLLHQNPKIVGDSHDLSEAWFELLSYCLEFRLAMRHFNDTYT